MQISVSRIERNHVGIADLAELRNFYDDIGGDVVNGSSVQSRHASIHITDRASTGIGIVALR